MKYQLRNWYPTSVATLLVMLIAALFGVGTLGNSPSTTYASDGGTVYPGNPMCSDFGLFEIAYFEPNYNTTIGPVTVSSADGVYFDWSSTVGIDAVIVKGGTDGNVYFYDEGLGDSGLHSPINPNNNMPFEISHISFCVDFELGVSKTATASYDRTITWNITKVEDESFVGFAGDTFNYDYDVTITKNVVENNYSLSGVVTVHNPAPFEAQYSVTDTTDVGIDLGTICSGVLPPGGSVDCPYSSSAVPGALSGTNTATATSSTPAMNGGQASAGFTYNANVIGHESVTFNDNPYSGYNQTVNSNTVINIPGSYTCSTADVYGDDLMYTDSETNTGTLVETGQSDDATKDFTCYIWDVDKTAEGSYNDQYRWEIEKTVDPESQSGFAGDTLEWTWSITWESFFVEEINHAVSGIITVTNPAPLELTVAVADELTGGFAASVTCNDGDGGTSLTIAANSSGTCNYTAEPGSQLANNTATASRNGVSFSDTVPVNWTQGEDVGLDAEISDSDNVDIPVDAAQPYEYTEFVECSTDTTVYVDNSVSYSGDATNTAEITWTDGSDESTAETSYTCYIWEVSKTAEGSYQDRYEWEINKTVDPEEQSGFAGDTLEWTWSITWESFFVEEINHAVEGVITVTNPADIELTVDVADELTGGFVASVTCNDGDGGTSLTIAANSSGTCDYTAEPGSQLAENTATASRDGVSISDTVPVNWTPGDDVGLDAEISDSDNVDIPVDSAQPYEYTESVECSTDTTVYVDNSVSYSGDATNTAEITWTDGSDESTAETSYTCYIWEVSKTAEGSYQDRYEWEINKTVDPEEQSGFAGDTLEWTWSITWESFFVEEINHAVSGVITVNNPADIELTVDVADELTGGLVASVTCNDGDGGTSLTIAANSSGTCDYTAEPGSQLAENTATASRDGVSISDTVPVNWTPGDDVGLDAEISDSDNVDIPVDSAQPYEYTESVECSTDTTVYVDNSVSYSGDATNTAEITWTDGSDESTAETSYTCYIPTLSKVGAGTYDETHTWDIEKSVSPTSQTGYPGDTLEWTWTVELSETVTESNFDVTGTITVVNPNPEDDLVVALTDVLNDGSLIAFPGGATECNLEVSAGQLLWTIPADTTAICNYQSLDLPFPGGDPDYTSLADAPTENRVDIYFNGVQLTAYADIGWTANVINGTANVDDNQEPDLPTTVNAGDGPWEWTETQSDTCSTVRSDYGDDGSYSETLYNTATVDGSDGQHDESSADTTYTCETSYVDVLKLTDGVPNESMNWTFVLSQDGTTLESNTTPPTLLEFQTTLRPGEEYTLCETGIPAGWTVQWALDTNGNGVIDDGETLPFAGGTADLIGDGLLQVYDPDPNYGQDGAVNDTRCVNFLADTDPGDTVSFIVDNRFPGGDPRTPGYWKNWNYCTSGNQPQTAANNGGPGAGWFLLDDLIPTSIGDLVIENCGDGVSILDQRDLATGRKRASDAAYTLAMHLLAAKLNLAAGAETCPAVVDAVAAGDALLSSIDFDGTGRYLRPRHPLYSEALDLAATLDAYNNGLLCTP